MTTLDSYVKCKYVPIDPSAEGLKQKGISFCKIGEFFFGNAQSADLYDSIDFLSNINMTCLGKFTPPLPNTVKNNPSSFHVKL